MEEFNQQLQQQGTQIDLSSMIIKKKRTLKTKKRKLLPEWPLNVESYAKQVTSDKCGKSRRCRKKRTKMEDLYNDYEAMLSVMERAEQVLENVPVQFPSFVMYMLPSNVTNGFWLILPQDFCDDYLPKHDSTILLVDEEGKEYSTNYLAERHGLSGGWRGFSLAHRLLKGDHLVFQKLKPCTFKVHIVRVYSLEEVDAALCLMNMDALQKGTYSPKKYRARKKAKTCEERLLLDIPQNNVLKNCPAGPYVNDELVAVSKTSSTVFGSELSEGSGISNHQENGSSCCQTPILHDHLLEACC